MFLDRRDDYYSILNVDKNSSFEEIKLSYKELVKKFHPDLNKEKDSDIYFKKILKAYTVLSDPDMRREYDKALLEEESKSRFKYSIDKFIQKKDLIFKKINIFFKNIYNKVKPNKKIGITEIDEFFLSKIDTSINITFEELELRVQYSQNEYLRAISAIMLGYKEEKKSVYLLEKALLDDSLEVRLCSAWALGNIGMKKSIAFLKKVYYDSNNKLKIVILYSLFKISKASLLIFNDIMRDALNSDSLELKEFAKNLYNYIKNDKIDSNIKYILNDEKVIFAGLNN